MTSGPPPHPPSQRSEPDICTSATLSSLSGLVVSASVTLSSSASSASSSVSSSRDCQESEHAHPRLPSDKLALLAKYFAGILLRGLPSSHQHAESQRMTLVFFCLSGLDLLGYLAPTAGDDAFLPLRSRRQEIVESIYRSQDETSGLFRPSAFTGPSLAITYCALATLRILGESAEHIRSRLCSRRAFLSSPLLQTMRRLQRSDGSMGGYEAEVPEHDLRYMYAAIASMALLEVPPSTWMPDVDGAVAWVLSCQSYDGAFGQKPHLESHGGSTFCAVASLKLLGRLDSDLGKPQRRRLETWLVRRQVFLSTADDPSRPAVSGGFQGRPHKDVDSCYSYWIGGSLQMLGVEMTMEARTALVDFVWGACWKGLGLARDPDDDCDVMHSYLSLFGSIVVCGGDISAAGVRRDADGRRVRPELGTAST